MCFEGKSSKCSQGPGKYFDKHRRFGFDSSTHHKIGAGYPSESDYFGGGANPKPETRLQYLYVCFLTMFYINGFHFRTWVRPTSPTTN